MPTLGKKSKTVDKPKATRKTRSSVKTSTKSQQVQEEVSKKAKSKKKKEVVQEVHPEQTAVPPFSDGIVSAKFCSVPSVIHAGGPEIDMLRAALHYFAVTEPFIGTVNTKVSFMKKKGGRLL